MAGYGYSNVTDKGFLAFARELDEGAWKAVSIKKYDADGAIAKSPLADAPLAVVWKVRATWGLQALKQARGAARALRGAARAVSGGRRAGGREGEEGRGRGAGAGLRSSGGARGGLAPACGTRKEGRGRLGLSARRSPAGSRRPRGGRPAGNGACGRTADGSRHLRGAVWEPWRSQSWVWTWTGRRGFDGRGRWDSRGIPSSGIIVSTNPGESRVK
jgi:hypothetical protein